MSSIVKKRMLAFIIDFFFVMLIMSILRYGFKSESFWLNYGIGVLCVLLRDIIFGGRSLGKIIMGLKVIDTKTDTRASIWKLIVRNITSPIWFVDAIIVFSDNSNPRLMDRALNLKVVDKNEDFKPL